MAKRGLGRGLGALIPDEFAPEQSAGAQQIQIEDIVANPSQPRTEFQEDTLEELAASIREHGILQPLILTRNSNDDGYALIAGERRLKAAKLAGLESVPAIVRDVTEQEKLELALIENIQREDLSAYEAARAYGRLNEEFGLSHEQISSRVGKSRTAVTNTIRLLKLPQQILSALHDGKISEGHARALLGLNSSKAQLSALSTIIQSDLNVRNTEELIRKLNGQKPEQKKTQPKNPPEIQAIEEDMRNTLGTKVRINYGKNGGTVVIHFYSDEELSAIFDQIK